MSFLSVEAPDFNPGEHAFRRAEKAQAREGLQSLCGNSLFVSGHGFNRAVTAAKSTRLQPLRACLFSCHTGSSARLFVLARHRFSFSRHSPLFLYRMAAPSSGRPPARRLYRAEGLPYALRVAGLMNDRTTSRRIRVSMAAELLSVDGGGRYRRLAGNDRTRRL